MSEDGDILVIGLGNPDCGDDGIGPLVARILADQGIGARVMTRRGDMLALIEDWAGSDAVIIIDAAVTSGRPGRVHRIDLNVDGLPRDLSLASTHAFGMVEAADLAAALDMRPRHLIIYAVEACRFEPGAPMSDEIAAVANEVAARVAGEVAAFSRLRGRAHA